MNPSVRCRHGFTDRCLTLRRLSQYWRITLGVQPRLDSTTQLWIYLLSRPTVVMHIMVSVEGFEPPTLWFQASHSSQAELHTDIEFQAPRKWVI